ncbi:uncharacterized protein [Amphiura filiformis]|uniref:uncharacterized protein n=1 Tax=Amphiura filiformis TaxID=82378 RepID=UPI003B20F24A
MDQATCSGCHFDLLPDDVLITIFSFLTLYERLLVMRTVSKRCYRILSSPQVWTHVDFWQEQRLTVNQQWDVARNWTGRCGKTWAFPKDIYSILDFLQKYTSGSLKTIYLTVVNKEILTYLKKNCGNLEIISFHSASDPPQTADIGDKSLTSHDIMPLPNTIKFCEFSVNFNLWTMLLQSFAQCKNLRGLSVHFMVITTEVCVALSKLTELSVLNMYVDSRDELNNGVHLTRQATAMLPLYKLTKLKSFTLFGCSFNRIIRQHTFQRTSNIDINRFFCAIVGKWQELRCMRLVQTNALSSKTFALLTSTLTQLQVLELHGETITDDKIILIAKHLKNLTTLKLLNGDNYTPTGLRVLSGHPSIERLHLVHQRYHRMQQLEWLWSVYDVILSLPKIVYVILTGDMLKELHRSEMHVKIPELAKNIHIEVVPVIYL